jgi:O-antigen/teichoic acid export membrane protein
VRSILRSTAVLGSGSAVAIMSGVVAAKAWALLLGPTGLGLMNILQSLLGLTTIIAGLGSGVALVRAGARALAQEDPVLVSALRKGAWLLFWASGFLAVILLLLFRDQVSRWFIGGSGATSAVALVAVAVIFNLALALETSLLNAYHRVSALAMSGAVRSVLAAALGIGLVWIWREEAIAPSILATAVAGWAVSRHFRRRGVGRTDVNPTRRQVFKASWSLMRFGVPYAGGMLAGAGVSMLIPVLALHRLGIEGVGFYAASAAIAQGYVGLVLNTMAQDYYPRVSAVRDNPAMLATLVNGQHRVVMVFGIPIILGMLAMARYIVPIVYSSRFQPAVEVLEWQLMGDLVKFSAWTMGFVILARNGSLVFFLTELVGGLSIIVSSWLGMRWFGLAGLGIASLTTSVLYYLVVSVIVHKDIGLVWTAGNRRVMLAALSAAVVIRLLPVAGLQNLKTPMAIFFAVVASLTSLYVVRKEMREIKQAATN